MAADATQILAEQAAMEQRRFNFEALWSEVASLLLPRQADFLLSGNFGAQGMQRTDRIFEESAMLGLDHGCAVFEGEVIPQGGQWQRFVARDPDLNKRRNVRLWLEQLADRLFALRNHPQSGFANQTHESVASLLSFGLQGMTTDKLYDARGMAIGLSYHSEHIGQLYVREDHTGAIECSHRKFELTHRQALSKWKDRAPEVVQKAVTSNNPAKLDERACYIHRLCRNVDDYEPGRIDYRGKPIYSCYLSIDDKQVFDEGGFRTRPLTVSRFEKSPMEDYGRCPAINVLPAIRAAQQIKADLVTAIEFMARPALGAHDDMLDQLINYSPHGITYGAIDDRGQPLVRALFDQADIQQGVTLLQETQAVIKRAFFEDLYIARDQLKSHISATEQMIRDQQRGVLLAPLKRQETEWFTPQTERELDLMFEMGMLADMPQELIAGGGLYETIYENPLGRARKAEQAAGFYQLLQGVAPLIQLDPQNNSKLFLQSFPFERVLKGLAEIHAVPETWSASDDEVAASKADAAALTKQESALTVGLQASEIAKNIGGATPPPQPAGGASA